MHLVLQVAAACVRTFSGGSITVPSLFGEVSAPSVKARGKEPLTFTTVGNNAPRSLDTDMAVPL
jgi:hypothetical protein